MVMRNDHHEAHEDTEEKIFIPFMLFMVVKKYFKYLTGLVLPSDYFPVTLSRTLR